MQDEHVVPFGPQSSELAGFAGESSESQQLTSAAGRGGPAPGSSVPLAGTQLTHREPGDSGL